MTEHLTRRLNPDGTVFYTTKPSFAWGFTSVPGLTSAQIRASAAIRQAVLDTPESKFNVKIIRAKEE